MQVPESVVYAMVLALVVLSPLIGFGRAKWLTVACLMNIGEYRVFVASDPSRWRWPSPRCSERSCCSRR
ncbi:hypothetical protein AB0I52_12430 [Streptomyces sp. NPDC050423]|uniref:hypothetical protein n=1 Tax=Streptomyces sp. NPDC050423 TaxID=3155402 RepID=UPI00341AE91D